MKEKYKIGAMFKELSNKQLGELASEKKDSYCTLIDNEVFYIIYDMSKPVFDAIVYYILIDKLAYLNVVSIRNKRPLSEEEKSEHVILKNWYYTV
jgi:hypothetical protein